MGSYWGFMMAPSGHTAFESRPGLAGSGGVLSKVASSIIASKGGEETPGVQRTQYLATRF